LFDLKRGQALRTPQQAEVNNLIWLMNCLADNSVLSKRNLCRNVSFCRGFWHRHCARCWVLKDRMLL